MLVIGGGIAGCALALFLHRAGLPVEIFEAYPSLATVEGGLGLGQFERHKNGLGRLLARRANAVPALEARRERHDRQAVQQATAQ